MLSLMRCPRCGYVQRRASSVDVNVDRLAERYAAGATLRQLAADEGCAYSTVRMRLIDAGYVLRPRNRKAVPDGVR